MKFQGDILNFCDFIQVFVFTTNHHLKIVTFEKSAKFSITMGHKISFSNCCQKQKQKICFNPEKDSIKSTAQITKVLKETKEITCIYKMANEKKQHICSIQNVHWASFSTDLLLAGNNITYNIEIQSTVCCSKTGEQMHLNCAINIT